MGTDTLFRDELPAVLAGLSSAVPDEAAMSSAARVLGAPDLDATIERLYPVLLRHKTLYTAMANLERAGCDLDAASISAEQLRSTYPLNRVLPPPDEHARRITLADLRRRLQRHRALHLQAVLGLVDDLGPGRFLLITGQAFDVAYPEYPRFSHDADLLAPDIATGADMLDTLCDRLGFATHGCKLSLLDRQGFALFKAFRLAEGHELNVGVMAGGEASAFLAFPLRTVEPLLERGRKVEVEGRTLLACSPEDQLLTTGLRPLREGYFTHRGFNDTRFLLSREEGSLDWDYVMTSARLNGTGGSLRRCLLAAERLAGRSLAPSEVVAALSPGRLAGRLLAAQERGSPGMGAPGAPARSSRTATRLSIWLWGYRFLRGRLGAVGAAGHFTADRFQARLFKWQVKKTRRRARGKPTSLPARFRSGRALRPRYRSACELREAPGPEIWGFCLSRVPWGRAPAPPRLTDEGRAALRAVARHFPEAGQEADFRKRDMDGAGGGQAHRCEAFLVNLARSR